VTKEARRSASDVTFVEYALELYVKVVGLFLAPATGAGLGTVITTMIEKVPAELNWAN
jgi:hypothetical protein